MRIKLECSSGKELEAQLRWSHSAPEWENLDHGRVMGHRELRVKGGLIHFDEALVAVRHKLTIGQDRHTNAMIQHLIRKLKDSTIIHSLISDQLILRSVPPGRVSSPEISHASACNLLDDKEPRRLASSATYGSNSSMLWRGVQPKLLDLSPRATRFHLTKGT